MDNRDNELFYEIIDIPTANTNYTEPSVEMNINQNIQAQSNIDVIDVPMNNTEPAPFNLGESQTTALEIIDFDLEEQQEEINNQGKVVNHELLENLSKDTNNLVNPDMIINPLGKSEGPSVFVNIEEPKVDYDEIQTKKGYVFMVVIFLIILLFIIFLPQIISFIGI